MIFGESDTSVFKENRPKWPAGPALSWPPGDTWPRIVRAGPIRWVVVDGPFEFSARIYALRESLASKATRPLLFFKASVSSARTMFFPQQKLMNLAALGDSFKIGQ
jgi:hypothetical protein